MDNLTPKDWQLIGLGVAGGVVVLIIEYWIIQPFRNDPKGFISKTWARILLSIRLCVLLALSAGIIQIPYYAYTYAFLPLQQYLGDIAYYLGGIVVLIMGIVIAIALIFLWGEFWVDRDKP